MSEHHIESIVEQTIGFLDSHDSENLDLRFYLLALYDFQYEFDTSNTYFRVMEDLLKHQFFFRLPHREVLLKFNKVDESDEVMVVQDCVYARFDTPTAALWSQAGLIGPIEPVGLGQASIAMVVNRVAEIEREQNDFHYSYYWFAALAERQLQNVDSGDKGALSAFKRNPDINAFRKHCKKIKAAPYVVENISEYPFSNFQFDEMDIESSNIIRWLSGVSGSRQSLVDCFSTLDETTLKQPSKDALKQRQSLGIQALERAHGQKLTVNKYAELFAEIMGSGYFLHSISLGPWGALYGIRFLSEALKSVISGVDQAFVCEGMGILLCRTDEFKQVLDGRELADYYKQLTPHEYRAEEQELTKIHALDNDNPELFYVDENGLMLPDYTEKLILTFPSKIAIESIYKAMVGVVIPEHRWHPFHLLEAFKKIRNTKTKAKYGELLMQKINELPEGDRTWFDLDHAAQCVFGVKRV